MSEVNQAPHYWSCEVLTANKSPMLATADEVGCENLYVLTATTTDQPKHQVWGKLSLAITNIQLLSNLVFVFF